MPRVSQFVAHVVDVVMLLLHFYGKLFNLIGNSSIFMVKTAYYYISICGSTLVII